MAWYSSIAAVVITIIQYTLKILYNLPILGHYIEFWSLLVTGSLVRFGSGHCVATNIKECKRPIKLLKLYEYEGCPFCRKVRETLSVLDLDAMIYPCPRETFKSHGAVSDTSRYRGEVKSLGGKAQFPFFIDENNADDQNKALQMYESDKIIKYLWNTYGDKAKKTPTYILGSTKISFSFLLLSSILRPFPQNGLMRIPSKKNKQPLELWSFEPSPFCKKVREILTSLELNYILRNAAHGSKKKRKEFYDKYGGKLSNFRKKVGMIQVPLLVDPNTNTIMIESEDIRTYLIKEYQTGEFIPTESLVDYVNSKKPQ